MSNEKKVIEQTINRIEARLKESTLNTEDRNLFTEIILVIESLMPCPELSQPEKTMQSWKHRPTEKNEPIGYLLNGSFIFASDVVGRTFDDTDTVVRLYGDPSAEVERLRKENETQRELLQSVNDSFAGYTHTNRQHDALNDIKEHLNK